jgi:hypothetical protein
VATFHDKRRGFKFAKKVTWVEKMLNSVLFGKILFLFSRRK